MQGSLYFICVDTTCVPECVFGGYSGDLPGSHRWFLLLRVNSLRHDRLHVPDVHYFHGEDLYRDNLFRRVLESDRGFTFCDLNQVSTYHSETPCKSGVRDASSSGPGH